MKNNQNLGSSSLQVMSLVAIGLITILAFWGSYHYNFVGTTNGIIWAVWTVLSLGLFSLTAEGKRALVFAKDARLELIKVVWPSRQETIQITMIVMVMVVATGLVLWGVDSLMTWAIGKITHLG